VEALKVIFFFKGRRSDEAKYPLASPPLLSLLDLQVSCIAAVVFLNLVWHGRIHRGCVVRRQGLRQLALILKVEDLVLPPNFPPSPEEALKSLRGAMAGYPHLRRLMDDLDDALKV
jgi:hypothetical protein